MRFLSVPCRLRLTRIGLCLVLVFIGSGCQVGHSWFQMDSNSSTPFFGLDLTPRYKTTQLTPPDDEITPDGRSPIRTAAHRPQSAGGWKRLQLPSLSDITGGEEETELSLTGPEMPFSR